MSLSHPLVRNVLGRYVYPAINTARNLFADTGRILTTLALFAKSITLGCGSNFLPYIVEEMKMKLNADDEKITKVFKIFAMMSLVGSLLGIFVFKKVRRQLGTMYILVGISVSMIMIPNCPGLDSFFIAVGIFGAFVGLIVPGQIVWTMEMWQKQSTPILQALMFFFSIGMSLPEYITAPFLTPVISNSTDVLDMMDVNETLSAPTNGTFGEFLRGIKHNFVAQTSGGQTQQFSNIHIPFAILGVMAFFNAWIERLLFKHYNYAPPPPPSPPQKQEEDKKGEDNRKGRDDKGDPSGKDFEQIKKYKPDEHFEEEDEEFLEEEYDQEEEEVEEEEEELRKDEDEEDEEDEDDDEGMESETSPMLKNQNKSFLQEIKVEQVRPPESRSSATLPVQKMIPAGVLSSVALPESPNKPSEEKSSTLPTPKRLIPEDKSSTMPAESEARERRRQSSIRRDSQIASLGRKLSSSLTKSKGTRRSRSGSKRNRKSLKKGPKDAKDEKTKEEEKVEGKDVEDYVESPKESEWEETVDDEEYEETDADFCEQPLLPKGGSEKGDGGIDLFEINSEDDIDTRRASTASMLDDNREDESSDPETEEVSEFSDEEGVVMPPAPPTASSSKENMLSDGEVKSLVKGSGIKDKVVSLVDDKLKSSDKERSGKGKSEEAITSKPAVVKKDEKEEETNATAKAPLGTTEKGQKLEEDKVKEKELQLEKDKAKEKEDKSKDKDQPVEKDKAKEVEGVEKKETGETPKDVPSKVAKKKDDGDEIKTAEKEDEQKMEMEQEAGDEGDGGNPVQKVINKIKSLKKIAVGVWNMLRDPVQRRGLYVIGLSSVFFGAYAAIEKCSKDLLPGLGQEGNLKLDEEGGALILKGFTMAFMVGRLAGMVISLKISPFLLLCSDLALVFLGNFMLIFGASFSEHIMLVGCVLLGLGLSTIYAGLFTFLCGLIPFTDVVGSVLIVLSSIATSVYADLIGDFISGNAQRLTSANYISGLTCTLAFKLIYSMTKPKKPSPPDLEQVVSVR